MTVVTGAINQVHTLSTPIGPKYTAAGALVMGAFVMASFSGTYAQSDDATLTAVPTALRAAMRNGKTCTLLSACFAGPGDENGTGIGAGLCTVSGTAITFPLTGSDLATEHANGALAAWNSDVCFYVTFTMA